MPPEGSRQKFQGSEPRSIRITPPYASSADQQLARGTIRNPLQMLIDDVCADTVNRPANGWQLVASFFRTRAGTRLRINSSRSGYNRAFCRSIVIDQSERQIAWRVASQSVCAGQQHSKRAVRRPLQADHALGKDGRKEADRNRSE